MFAEQDTGEIAADVVAHRDGDERDDPRNSIRFPQHQHHETHHERQVEGDEQRTGGIFDEAVGATPDAPRESDHDEGAEDHHVGLDPVQIGQGRPYEGHEEQRAAREFDVVVQERVVQLPHGDQDRRGDQDREKVLVERQ